MSQDSIDTVKLVREIDESILAHQALLDYSNQSNNLILPNNMNQQVDDTMAGTQHTGISDEFSQLSQMSQTVDMGWDNPEFFAEEISLCQEYINHFSNLTKYYQTLKETLTSQGMEAAKKYLNENAEPQKPSKNIKQVVKHWPKIKSKTKTKKLIQLDGLDLLEELKKYVLVQSTSELPSLKFDKNEANIDKIKSHLINCNNLLKSKQSNILGIVVVYGQWLDKFRNIHFGRFKSVCRETLEITPNWCRKLIKISTLFTRFSKLQQLSLSITEVSQLVKKIEIALEKNTTEEEFWRS